MPFHNVETHSTCVGPELPSGQCCTVRHGVHLGPRDVRVYPVAIPAVRTSNDVLASHDVGVAHDTIRHELRGLYGGSLVGDDGWNIDLAVGALYVLPDLL